MRPFPVPRYDPAVGEEDLKRFIQEAAAKSLEHSERLAAANRAHSEKLAAETRTQFGVIAEGLRGELRQVAAGVVSTTDRVDRLAVEMQKGFLEVGSMIKLSSSELDRNASEGSRTSWASSAGVSSGSNRPRHTSGV
jgi:hypothetical protein